MKLKHTLILILAVLCLGSTAGCGGQPNAGNPGSDANASANLNPKAVAVNTFSGNELTLVSPQRETISSIAVTDNESLWSDNVVFTGKMDGGDGKIPFVYTTYTPEVTIQLHQNGGDQMLRTFDSLGRIAGSRGEPAIAFSEVSYDEYSLNSYLYVGNLDNVGFSTAVYENKDYLNQWILAPLAVDVVDGQPGGVWFTTSGWGVGGPGLFFPVTQGLYYFDITSGSVKEYLSDRESLQGLSPDRTLAASTPSSSYADHDMTITNLMTHWRLTFPLKATSDQGSGLATFAQDNQHAAWLEVGTSPIDEYEYKYVVRVGSLVDGEIEFEIDEKAVAQALQFSDLSNIQPLGWLDSSTLLIQARGSDWKNARIAQLNLADHSLVEFCRGTFIGFIY